MCSVADESQAIKLLYYVKCIFHFGENEVVTVVQSGENTYEDDTMRCNTAKLPGIRSNQAAGRTCSSQKLYEFFADWTSKANTLNLMKKGRLTT